MTTVPSQGRAWRKSSHSGNDTSCVEITMDVVDGTQDVGDTKNHGGPTLTFPRAGVVAFLGAAQRGQLNLPR